MTTWFVSRHPGALAWMLRNGPAFDRHVQHLDTQEVQPGDTVIGTLPADLGAEVCARGARYLHLSLRVQASDRGRELSADELQDYRATLQPLHIGPAP